MASAGSGVTLSADGFTHRGGQLVYLAGVNGLANNANVIEALIGIVEISKVRSQRLRVQRLEQIKPAVKNDWLHVDEGR
jgi:hypothetical protein